MIRPILEYACVVWNPFLLKQIKQIESVQRLVTKRVCGYSSLSYDERLRLLHLPTLSCRRQYFDLVEIYKIIHSYSFTTLKCKFLNRSSRGHSFRIWQDRFKRNTRKSALIIRAARHWNMLPSSIVDAKTLSSFKYKLRQHLNV
jgi:hypothetical protein